MAYHSSVGCDLGGDQPTGYATPSACFHTPEITIAREIAEYVQAFPYNNIVFLLPPWEEIYGKDSERDQTFEEAVEVFEGMKRWYCQWGYETLNVPRGSAYERASYIVKSVKALTNRF